MGQRSNGVTSKVMTVCGMTIALAACASEVPDAEQPVETEIADTPIKGTIRAGGTTCQSTNFCTAYSTSAKQKIATNLMRYVLGDTTKAPPTTTSACAQLKSSLDALRTAWQTGTVTLSPSTQKVVCGLPATTVRFTRSSVTGTDWENILAMRLTVDQCYGSGVRGFLISDAEYCDPTWDWIELDPEPAVLTASLGSTAGATAGAYLSNSYQATTAVRFGSTFTSCGTAGNYPGAPCGTTALASGTTISTVLFKSGSLCACR